MHRKGIIKNSAIMLILLLFLSIFSGWTTLIAKAETNDTTTDNNQDISIPVSEIKLDVSEKTLLIGESFELKPTISPEDATNKEVVWETSNDKIATVVNGKVTAVGVGEAVITVKSQENNEINAQCKVIVNPINVSSIKLDEESKTIRLGESFKLTATIEPQNATNKEIKWQSSNSNVVIVDNTGNIKAVGVGSATITVVTDDGKLKATCAVIVLSNKLTIKYVESKLVVSTPVITITQNTKLYTKIKGKKKANVAKQTKVVILDNKDGWYLIKLPNGTTGWIQGKYLKVVPGVIRTDKLSKEELEFYVNYKKFKSSTNNFVWVDIARQKTYVFSKDENGRLNLTKEIIVATGKDVTPTIRGLFELNGQRGTYMYFPQYKSSVKNWVRITGGYLFHSITYSKDGKRVLDPTLGKKRSHGCVRMSEQDSYWMYKNIPNKTAVWIN